MKLHPVELERLTPEILHVFGRQPPLLTAGDKTGLNTMTIGWCQLGRLWNLPVCTVYVRSTGRPWPCAAPRAAGTWTR